jgi:hypothetical protein
MPGLKRLTHRKGAKIAKKITLVLKTREQLAK